MIGIRAFGSDFLKAFSWLYIIVLLHAFVIIEGKNKTEVGIIVKSVEVHNKIRKLRINKITLLN